MKQPNRLINEKSPYLRQHANQPIDWYPWGDEAFKKAKKEDKPIFLSIGYSTCHWCHVMAKESFMDEEVASILNEHFISIKVDREERPDIDTIYMEVCQAITGSAGWPLTVVMTPDQVPFFAATYLPKYGNHRGHGLIEVLTVLETKWKVKREDVNFSAEQVKNYFEMRAKPSPLYELDEELFDEAFQLIEKNFDPKYGGFTKAPKFPAPQFISFLIRYNIMKKNDTALSLLNKTLIGMIKGGVYDQIGSGFSRYAVDQKWLIPHFEKMLYDNALLTTTYIDAYLHTDQLIYKKTAKDILSFVERELLSPEGGFYTALDADSEGIEGRYYLWTKDELKAFLTPEELGIIVDYYQITDEGNFNGLSILNRIHIPDDELIESAEIETIKTKLLNERMKRIPPHRDEKILTGMNAMMIHAFTRGYMAFGETKYLQIAENALSFILKELTSEDGRLLARYIDGEAKYFAYSDDYAYMILALIELFLATNKLVYIDQALHFTNQMIEYYYDSEYGGFYQTAADSEDLLFRNKDGFDGSTPSANAVMTLNFLRLAEIFDEPKYEEYALRQLKVYGGEMNEHPLSMIHFITAFMMYKVPKRKIVLVTEAITDEVIELQEIVRHKCIPCTEMITLLKEDIQNHPLFEYYLEDHHPIALHICEKYTCNDPIYDIEEMKEALNNLILMTLE